MGSDGLKPAGYIVAAVSLLQLWAFVFIDTQRPDPQGLTDVELTEAATSPESLDISIIFRPAPEDVTIDGLISDQPGFAAYGEPARPEVMQPGDGADSTGPTVTE